MPPFIAIFFVSVAAILSYYCGGAIVGAVDRTNVSRMRSAVSSMLELCHGLGA